MDNIHLKETLTIEFKSDLKRLPDSDIVEAVVALPILTAEIFIWA